jgi:hypothetical protein
MYIDLDLDLDLNLDHVSAYSEQLNHMSFNDLIHRLVLFEPAVYDFAKNFFLDTYLVQVLVRTPNAKISI